MKFLLKKTVLAFSGLLTAPFAFSQDFEVAPSKLNYDCEPGQIQTKLVSIQNHSNHKQQFTFTLGDWQIDSLGNPSKNINKERSCKDWITINPAFFDLNPNESKEVKVILQVPPSQSQTRWAMIYVTPTEEQTSVAVEKNVQAGIKVKPRIGIRVVQSPVSNSNYQATIGDLKEITQPKDSSRIFSVKVSNTGDKIIEGKIYLVLSNLSTAQETKVKPVKISVLPGSKRISKLSFPKTVPPGKYSLAAILDYGGNSALEAVQMTIEVK